MTSDSGREAANDIVSSGKAVGREQLGDMSEALSSAAGQVASVADQARETVGGAAQNAARGVANGLPDTKDAMLRGHARVRRSVVRQPVEALLLAGAIGYLAGWLANRS